MKESEWFRTGVLSEGVDAGFSGLWRHPYPLLERHLPADVQSWRTASSNVLARLKSLVFFFLHVRMAF